MNISNCKNKLGFTLLELILVILIIGVLATLGITFYQTQTLTSKISRTATQMQQISQAAAAYYIDNGCWPTSAQNTNCKQCTTTPPDFNEYLKLSNTTNPFGSGPSFTYSYEPEPQNCKKFQVFSGELPAPTNDPQAIVRRVIADLPNGIPATIPTPPNQVMTEVVVPAGVGQQVIANYLVKYIGISPILYDGSSRNMSPITCPAGWTAGGFVSPVMLHPSDWITSGWKCGLLRASFGPGSLAISNLSAPVTCGQGNPAGCYYTVSYTASHLKDELGCPWETIGAGQVQFLEVEYCINPNPTKNTKKIL